MEEGWQIAFPGGDVGEGLAEMFYQKLDSEKSRPASGAEYQNVIAPGLVPRKQAYQASSPQVVGYNEQRKHHQAKAGHRGIAHQLAVVARETSQRWNSPIEP